LLTLLLLTLLLLLRTVLLLLTLVLLLALRWLGWTVLRLRCLLLLLPQRTLLPEVPLLPAVVTTRTLLALLCSLLDGLLCWELQGQHRLFPKRKKKTHSPDCLRGAGALELMDPTLCSIRIAVACKRRRSKTKEPLQKHGAVLRCCCWSLLPNYGWYLWLNRCCLRGRWWLLLCRHLCKLRTSCWHLLVRLVLLLRRVLPRTLKHRSLPLLHDGRRGCRWIPLLPLLLLRSSLRQRVVWLLEMLGLSTERHLLGYNRTTPCSDTIVTAPAPGSPATTKDPTVGTAAHGSGDPEGIMDRSNEICDAKTRGNTATRDADYCGPVSSLRRGGNCCEFSPTKQGVSFTKKPSRDYQSPTDEEGLAGALPLLAPTVCCGSWKLPEPDSPAWRVRIDLSKVAALCAASSTVLHIRGGCNLRNFSTCITGSSAINTGGGGGTGATKGTSTLGGTGATGTTEESKQLQSYTAGATLLEVLTLHRYDAALNWTSDERRPPRSHLWGGRERVRISRNLPVHAEPSASSYGNCTTPRRFLAQFSDAARSTIVQLLLGT
ncbi:hypothetical protein Taro_017219, partial [Colocasia esculenta]|nr:hypothetical protein [Colocasia esculenta]